VWVISLFDELHDPQVLEVVLKPGVRATTVECRSAAGPLREHTLPSHLVAGVFAKMKKPARLDVAEPSHMQGSRTDFRLAESVPAAAGSIRQAGGHSRGILVLGVRSDLLALPASRLGSALETQLCPQYIDPPSRPAYDWVTP
jgi:hypothetical protein